MPSEPMWMWMVRVVPTQGLSEWVCCGAPATIEHQQWLKQHEWEIPIKPQQLVGIPNEVIKKKKKKRFWGGGSAGSHAVVLCKSTYQSFPLISQVLQVPFHSWRVPCFTACQWTWLLFDPFLLDTTFYPYCRSLLAVSLFNRATRQRINAEHSVSGNKWLQEHFYIKHPLPIRYC